MELTIFEKRLNASCWWLYLSAVLIYIVFIIFRIQVPFLESEAISIFATFLLGVTVFLSLSISLKFKNAGLLLLYWAIIIILAEKYYLSIGRYEFQESSFYILGNVPFNLFFNWLIPLFGLYSLGTYITSRFSFKSKRSKLITHLIIDGLLIICFGLLHDPMNVAMGYWAYHPSEMDIVAFGVPIYIYFEYLIAAIIINFPLRWLATYRSAPNLNIYYQPKVSYPLYFGWSFFLAMSLRQFPVKLYTLGVFGAIVTLIITLFIIWKRRASQKLI